jgi:hypothetical protein
MNMHRIKLFDQRNNQIGWLDQDWHWLPDIIQVGSRYFNRQGPSGGQFYVEVGVHVVKEHATLFG